MRSSHIFSTLLLASLLSGCVTVPNTRNCQVAGDLTVGMVCVESNTGRVCEMSMHETLDFLQPQLERTCVPHGCMPGVCRDDQTTGELKTLPARAGAVAQNDDDFTANKIAMEKACRQNGSKCKYEIPTAKAHAKGLVSGFSTP